MSIRLSIYEDLEALVEIYNQAIEKGRSTADTETFSVEKRIPWFKEHQSIEYPLYIYEIDNKVVGYMYLSPYRPGRKAMRFTVEVSYYIHNDYQRKGIGIDLMEFAIQRSRELNYRTLVAILLDCNIPSIKLLEKFSFQEWGRLVDIADFDDYTCSHLYYGLKL